MDENIRTRLKLLPVKPGVYFHKSKTGEIIYIGKAATLKNRVRQYFQNSRYLDNKTRALVAEIVDIDWLETDSEIDALFLEAEMIKRYMPRYNILLRDDKSQIYVRIDMKSEWPHVSYTRNPLDDEAEYFGPYYNSFPIKKALRYLRKIFPYYIKPISNVNENRLTLDDHIGLSPFGMTSSEYKSNLRKLISYIKGNRKKLLVDLESEMKKAALNHNFELAAVMRNKINDLKLLQKQIMFGDKEFIDISKDKALRDLTELFSLNDYPKRIEGYDISHMSGTNVVASMVVFMNGVSNRSEYRKFKIKQDKNDDFANMREVISRRFSEKNMKTWGVPDFVLIDGGKGQLESVISVLTRDVPFIGLAKREEELIVSADSKMIINYEKVKELSGSVHTSANFITISLPQDSHIIRLFQRVRDESHRFAVSYHTSIKRAGQIRSLLEEIPGIGPKTRQKIMKHFKSIGKLVEADEAEIKNVVGSSKAKIIIKYKNAL